MSWVANCAQIGGGGMAAVEGGVWFSLSFLHRFVSIFDGLEDFLGDRSADRPVEGFCFPESMDSSLLIDFDLGVFALSFPINDFNDTELFDFLCMPGLFEVSLNISTDFLGDDCGLGRYSS